MATHHDPRTPMTRRTGSIADRVERYRSKMVAGELWERYSADLKALVLAAEPASAEDAKSILGTASMFILDATAGERDLRFDELFTAVEVAAYCERFQRTKGRTKTYANHRGRLNRLLRAKNGVAQQTRSVRSERVEPAPYTEAELRGAVGVASSHGDYAAAQVMALGAGAGRVGDAARRITVMPTLTFPADGLGCRPGERVTVDAAAWRRARRHARAAGFELTQRRLEITWAASLVVCPSGSLGQVIRDHGLSRRLLENTYRACPTPSDVEVVAVLAGL